MPNREYDSREPKQTRNEESSNSFLMGAIIGFNNQAGSLLDKTTTIRESVLTKSNELVSKGSSLSQGIVLQSSGLVNKVKGKITNQAELRDEERTYIPIQALNDKEKPKKSIEIGSLDSAEIRKKLEEAEKAFDEEENKVKL
jgi:hypothetical protein